MNMETRMVTLRIGMLLIMLTIVISQVTGNLSVWPQHSSTSHAELNLNTETITAFNAGQGR